MFRYEYYLTPNGARSNVVVPSGTNIKMLLFTKYFYYVQENNIFIYPVSIILNRGKTRRNGAPARRRCLTQGELIMEIILSR
jgi:hypothetical protein